MKKVLLILVYLLSFIGIYSTALAAPVPPVLTHTTNGLDLSISWDPVPGATGYILSYAPNPYTGLDSIGTVDVSDQTNLTFTLWDGASFYIATQSYDATGSSEYSNIGLFTLSLETSDFVSGTTYGNAALIDEGTAFTTFTSQELDVELGSISVAFKANSETYKFANIAIDFNGDGLFAPYTVAEETQEEWSVKNIPLQVISGDYSFLTDLFDSSVVAGSALNVRIILTEEPMDESVTWAGAVPANATGLDATVTATGVEWTSNASPSETSVGAGSGAAAISPLNDGSTTTAEDVSIVDGTLYRSGMPDGAQGLNQCVAQSIANNLSWLARRYNFTDKLNTVYKEEDGYSDEEKDYSKKEGVSILGSIVNTTFENLGTYDRNVGVKGTAGATSFAEAVSGLKTNILAGKNKFVSDNNLPVESSIITVGSDSSLFNEIKKSMGEGCAIEVVLEIIDSTGKTIGGHAVSVAGFADFELHTSQYTGLTFHDGDTGNATENTPINDTYPLNGDTIDKFPFTKGNKVKLYKAKLNFAVKQCYKEPVTQVGCAFGTFDGNYQLAAISIVDPASHLPFTGNPFSSSSVFMVTGNGSGIGVSGPGPFVDVSGPLEVVGDGCSFTATGAGTVAGFSNVSVEMNGTLSSSGLMGSYEMGAAGELFGTPIIFNFEGQSPP